MRKAKSILVTGAAGFIGSAFVRHVLKMSPSETQVVSFDKLTYAGNRANLRDLEGNTQHRFVKADICDAEAVEKTCREYHIDCIVNFAAESHVDRSILGPKEFIDTNIVGTFSLLEVARKLGGIHFHQVSTDEVFGSLGKTGLFTEKTPYDPRSPYSASKAAADHLARAYAHTYSLSLTLSNCSNNYGPYQFPEKLIPLMILNAIEGKKLPVYGDGSNVRDWLYVDDHVEAIWTVILRGEQGESYNIGGGCELSNMELLHQLLRVVAQVADLTLEKLKSQIEFVADRPGHDQRYAIDASKIKQTLGWAPRFAIEGALKQTVEWFVENSGWVENVRSGAYQDWVEENYSGR